MMDLSSFKPKLVIFESLAEVARALSHPNRIDLLEHLAQGERSVEDLADVSGMSFANTSRHLQILRRARLVEPTRRGKHILYSLASDAEVVTLLRALGHCVFAVEAVAALRAKGFKARRLEDGFPEWKAAGLSVESL